MSFQLKQLAWNTGIDEKNATVAYPLLESRVAILLCTYQGQRYLSEQLSSIERQNHANWIVWASDDGSRDDTRAILECFQERWGKSRVSIQSGPAGGFAANFLSLVSNTEVSADYYSFADQDDIWEPVKVERAVDWLRSIPSHIPALYCARTTLVDEENREIGFSPFFGKPPCFANALVQNIGAGNTMVFNEAARNILRRAGDIDVVSHDWWVYLVVSGCGGRVYYDSSPSLRYRQHGRNLIGSNMGICARAARVQMMLAGVFREWNDRNVRALEKVRDELTPESKRVLDLFLEARAGSFLPRVKGLIKSGVHRQTFMGNLGLILAAVFGKI
ncbi:glycosyltransferase family 2 protein [Pseudomonas sp. DY-1]|uniref:glycosyltransferase family 2 protein n=1 Tax=Pseudomonas sp. DY-1 TaxID=1755504 RepID=UPI000EA8AE56|nr:glycosyltransferase family 2 protein [Pseudomonas sp. DY-1]AYF89598.1 glycosyltransferase family 2 protein [Pseudomonas sp. DY-1]